MFNKIISLENLFFAWKEFKRGKMHKRDVENFALDVEDHIFALHEDLKHGIYCHSPYTAFYVRDPKLRHIHKPAVRDRVLHHAIFMALEPLFEPYFIFNSYSYSSRKSKGTHRAVSKLRQLAWRLSRNNTKTVWLLHCDVRKFFDSVDQEILLRIIKQRLKDDKVFVLIEQIIRSFQTLSGKGIPLGNLTSQLFSNVYLNKLDQFITQSCGIQDYLRYADDFVIISKNKIFLESLISIVRNFLEEHLKLILHPKKIVLRPWHQGLDFLGYVSFPHHTVLRTKTKRRMLRRLRRQYFQLEQGVEQRELFEQSKQSYLGALRHCRGNAIKKVIENFS
jgi:retron-type reverse transcriptase